MTLQWTELIVFLVLFLAVTVMGFVAARWRAAGSSLDHLDEWGLGGRKFGSWITWFLIGGDTYTAYTFVAVPAVVFGSGSTGFFAVPYTIITYPIILFPILRLWSVSKANGFVTPADFVQGRYGSPTLSLLIALTGIIATMPYIALQLAGLEAVLRTMGLNGSGLAGHLPLFIAFVILAFYTYQSGLRAPALIAFVKDTLIWVVVLVAVIYLPAKLGGWGSIFSHAGSALAKPNATGQAAGSLLLPGSKQLQYSTLALGSALALFLYPHAITGTLAAKGRSAIKRNMVALPAYSLMLGLIALLGFVALAAGTKPIVNNATRQPDTNTIVPTLFLQHFPHWFAGLAFAAIGIGALVPAAIMSIGAANLWTRNVYKQFLRPDATPRDEARQAKLASLVVKFGAVAFIVFIDPQFSIDLQLIGGALILQTLPSVAIALYTRWLHVWGLIVGWIVGIGWAVIMLYSIPSPDGKHQHFGGSGLALGRMSLFGWHPFMGSQVQIYPGFVALVANLVVAVVVTLIVRAIGVANGKDATKVDDYHADESEVGDREAAAAVG